MNEQGVFGPRLRSSRLRKGVTLESLERATNVPIALWEALEDNDLHGWPSGVLARAWVAEYARLTGLDASETVNDFCRLFPQGDRRRETIVTGMAQTIGHTAGWTDDWRREERRAPLKRLREERQAAERHRAMAGLLDLALMAAIAAVIGALSRRALLAVAAPLGLTYLAVVTTRSWPLTSHLVRFWMSRTGEQAVPTYQRTGGVSSRN